MNLKSHSTFKILFFTIYLLIGILLSSQVSDLEFKPFEHTL